MIEQDYPFQLVLMQSQKLAFSSGLDFSSEWRDRFLAAREMMRRNLHILHPSHQTILKICHNKVYSKLLLVDLSEIRYVI